MALFCLSYSNAQQIDPTTGNLVYTTVNPPPDGWSNHTWTGFVNTTSSGGGTSEGNIPGYNPTTGTFIFGYSQGTVSYSTPIAAVFANSGPGILVNGFTYSWNYFNQDYSRGTLSSNINLTNSAGTVLHSYNYNMPQTTAGWTNISGVQNFGVSYNPLTLGNLNLSLTGKDDRFWAGYYGPQIKDIDVRLKYSVDPCAANPLYSSSCPGFNDIVLSGNLVPNPGGFASWGQSLNQTFSIATALQHGGMGVKVHGFQWGYDTFSGNPYCADWLIVCLDNRDPLVRTNVNIKDSAGNSLYSVTRDYNDHNYWISQNYSYVLPQSKNSLTLGNFEFSGQTWDYAGITNMYARIQYTPDQCVLNPLFSTSCTGYQQAYFDQQCSFNSLYSNQCPGYAQAYFDQQCSLNPLYDSSCPGYAQAYFNQQCSINGLYNKACPNYQTAFLAAQCEINQLYSTQCPGYTQAKLLKDLQDQQVAQTQTATQSSTTTTTSTSGSTSSPTATTNTATADPTRTETVVTTDVGGVELTTGGQISVPTGQTASTKEAIKESTKTEESKTEAANKETEKKRIDPRALAIAKAAVAATEKTALAVSEAAVIFSQSETATNPTLGLGSGITLSGFRPIGVTTEADTNKDLNTNTRQTNNVELTRTATTTIQQPEMLSKNTSSVRNGGRVEGMEGGPDPAQLAKAPMDFSQYLNMQLKDSQFYAAKEIYKNQKVIDNQRVLRQLNGRSDRMHEEMVNEQYR